MKIIKMNYNQVRRSIELIWNVFLEYEAPDYGEKGKETFKNLINDNAVIGSLEFIGAYEKAKLLGVIATKDDRKHISFFFVDSEFQNKGVGRSLWEHLLNITKNNIITVNSSPYAVPIYQKFGFVIKDAEQEINGIRFIPMEYNRKREK